MACPKSKGKNEPQTGGRILENHPLSATDLCSSLSSAMNPTIVEEDKAIDFGDLYGLSGHPLQHRGYALCAFWSSSTMYRSLSVDRESNGSRIKWVFDLSGTFLLDGGRECGVGNVCVQLSCAAHSL